MKSFLFVVMAGVLFIGLALTGCGKKEQAKQPEELRETAKVTEGTTGITLEEGAAGTVKTQTKKVMDATNVALQEGTAKVAEILTSNDAIEVSKTLSTVKEKVAYLITKAEEFYNSDKFKETISITQHILTNLDQEYQKAKDLLNKARSMFVSKAESVVGEAKKEIGNKLGGFGQ
jgi:hypothetical protein